MFTGILSAQTFTVEKVSGDVKYQNGSSENWLSLNSGSTIEDDAIISTGDNSSVVLGGSNVRFNLNESSAISVSSIKKMNTDELLLALAMEDMMNAPKEIKNSSSNTAVYGTKEGESNTLQIKTDDFWNKEIEWCGAACEKRVSGICSCNCKGNLPQISRHKKSSVL